MTKLNYAAYGSCMSIESLHASAPSAKLIGKGVIKDMELVFYSAANLDAATGKEAKVAVFSLDKSDLYDLDRREGHPNHYERIENIEVILEDGSVVDCFTYLMTEWKKEYEWSLSGSYEPESKRSGYLEEVCTGYDECGWGRNALTVKTAPDRKAH